KLWSYWTDPAKYAKWLNPAPLDLVIHEFDVRVGGKVRFDMPQPDGNKNPQEGVFHVLKPYTEIVSGNPDKSFLIKVNFTPVDPTMLPKFFWPVGEGKVDHLEFKVGGSLRMSHSTEPWTATWTFVEIVPNRKIVTSDPWPDGSGTLSVGTMEFIPKDGGCLMR